MPAGGTRTSNTLQRRFLSLGLVALLCFSPAPRAATIYVNKSNNTGIEDGTAAHPFNTIQEGVNVALSNDTVSVAPGTYAEAVETQQYVPISLIGAGSGLCIVDATGKGKPALLLRRGMSRSHVVQGFTFRGGSGANRSTATPPKFAGGGVFVFSSPTITNNLITGNAIAGNQKIFAGGGIYVGIGNPLITQNLITGNNAKPGQGTVANPTFGYGGGIYVNYFANAEITDNVISGNTAGDTTKNNTFGEGGGIHFFNGYDSQPGVIDRNTIRDNIARNYGGGIGIGSGSLVGGGSDVVITNNVIEGNINNRDAGGGVYTYYSNVTLRNNTLHGNQAPFGGGVLFGPTSTALYDDILINNVITANSASGGGGVFVDPLASPQVESNDIWGNLPNEYQPVAADPAGTFGNISANPLLTNPAADDFHLLPGSPAIDVGLAAGAPATDREGMPRPRDGNGDGTAAVDMGAYERQPPVSDVDGDGVPDGSDNCPSIANANQANSDGDALGNVCDACPLDAANDSDTDGVCGNVDNCPTVANANQLNRDQDSLGNACDTDADGDGLINGADCSPLDPILNSLPGEVGETVHFADAGGTMLWWTAPARGRVYSVYGADVDVQSPWSWTGACVSEAMPAVALPVAAVPATGWLRAYLVTALNACGEGSPGQGSAGEPHTVSGGCLPAGRDLDLDGYADLTDNCPTVANTSQADADGDGLGDACE